MWSIGLIGVLLIIAWLLGLILFEASGFGMTLVLLLGIFMVSIGVLAQLRQGRPRAR